MIDELGLKLHRAKDDPPRKTPRWGYLIRNPRPIRNWRIRRKKCGCRLVSLAEIRRGGISDRDTWEKLLEVIGSGREYNRKNRRRAWFNRHRNG